MSHQKEAYPNNMSIFSGRMVIRKKKKYQWGDTIWLNAIFSKPNSLVMYKRHDLKKEMIFRSWEWEGEMASSYYH